MTKTLTKDVVEEKLDQINSSGYILYLHNDDHNSFDHVITCLMKFCDHEFDQATQCAHIVHFTGLCDVKRGTKSEVEKPYKLLHSNGLTVTIESI
jgi:ATP-dependent Clp protease adaptor protein ClpS